MKMKFGRLSDVAVEVKEIIERGKKLIYPQRTEEWESILKRPSSMWFKMDEVVEIMEALESGESIESINQRYGECGMGVIEYVALFSKRGPEYGRTVLSGKMSEETEEFFDEIEDENIAFEEELAESESGGESC